MTGYAETTTYAVARPVLEACGRRRRFFAALLDGVVLAFVGMIVGIAITLAFDGSLESFGLEQSPGTTTWNSGIGDDLGGTALAISVVMTAITAVYFVAFHATTGQTPGKAMLGIKVVDVHTGDAPNLGTSILRYAVYARAGAVGGGHGIRGAAVGVVRVHDGPRDAGNRGVDPVREDAARAARHHRGDGGGADAPARGEMYEPAAAGSGW
jgi:uncharacterized RDD family membrane protein YckC